jgi:hypothetical protein
MKLEARIGWVQLQVEGGCFDGFLFVAGRGCVGISVDFLFEICFEGNAGSVYSVKTSLTNKEIIF